MSDSTLLTKKKGRKLKGKEGGGNSFKSNKKILGKDSILEKKRTCLSKYLCIKVPIDIN